MTQATVEDVSAAKASKTDAKLVDPNTGAELHASSEESDKKPASSKQKPRAAPKSKAGAAVVDPNTGEKVEAAATVHSKPAAKRGYKGQVKHEANEDQAGPSSGSAVQGLPEGVEQFVKINRAPVLTLWVAVVAESQGFSKEAGLTFGKAISGMLAQSKGR